MTMLGSKTQSRSARKPFSIDWADFLEGDTITESSWSISPDGLNKQDESLTGAKATVWLSGGQSGARYVVTNQITTAGGITDERSFEISIS